MPPIESLKDSQPPWESMKLWAWDSVMQVKPLGETASQLQPHRLYEQVIVSCEAALPPALVSALLLVSSPERRPQSVASVPYAQSSYSDPGPPSSHRPFEILIERLHESSLGALVV